MLAAAFMHCRALGCTLYAMLVGRPPFEASDGAGTSQRAMQWSFPDDPSISSEARGLVSSMLRPYPDDRPTLRDILQHAFFTQCHGNSGWAGWLAGCLLQGSCSHAALS